MPVCLNCGRTVSDNDIYYDVESNKFGCIYCMEDKIKQHSDWCKEWREQNMEKETQKTEKVVEATKRTESDNVKMQYVVTLYDYKNFYFDFDTHELGECNGVVTLLNQKGQMVFLVPLSKVECIIVKEVRANKNSQDSGENE